MTGGADRMLAEAVRMLREAGHEEQAGLVERAPAQPGRFGGAVAVLRGQPDVPIAEFTVAGGQARTAPAVSVAQGAGMVWTS